MEVSVKVHGLFYKFYFNLATRTYVRMAFFKVSGLEGDMTSISILSTHHDIEKQQNSKRTSNGLVIIDFRGIVIKARSLVNPSIGIMESMHALHIVHVAVKENNRG